jgi:lipoate-protein ligase A
MNLVFASFPDNPPLDIAISKALLDRISQGDEEDTLRIYIPPKVIAFGPQDITSKGFNSAKIASRIHGFVPVRRIVGGRALAMSKNTIAFSLIKKSDNPRSGLIPRFIAISNSLRTVLKNLGLDANVGKIDGEYCPGDFSVNARHVKKIIGIGQRIASKATYLGGVIVLENQKSIKEILTDIYSHLEIEWNPNTVGSISEEIGKISIKNVIHELIEVFSLYNDLREVNLSKETLNLAKNLIDSYKIL